MKKKMIFISTFCVLFDQLSKYFLGHFLYLNESVSLIPSFFSITNVRNEGAAWSILAGRQNFLIFISLLALFILYNYFVKGKTLKRVEQWSYGLLFGGIFGNLLDRIIRGYVIDFFDFTVIGYHFPVFNIADICIVIGVLFVIISLWKEEPKHEKNRSN